MGVHIGSVLLLLLEAGDVAGIADHPAQGDDEIGAGQGLHALRHLVRIEAVHLVDVVEIGDGAGVVGEDEAVPIQGEVRFDLAAVAHLDLERPVGPGVHLHAGADEPPVDGRPGQQIVDVGLDRTHACFDIGVTHRHPPTPPYCGS